MTSASAGSSTLSSSCRVQGGLTAISPLPRKPVSGPAVGSDQFHAQHLRDAEPGEAFGERRDLGVRP